MKKNHCVKPLICPSFILESYCVNFFMQYPINDITPTFSTVATQWINLLLLFPTFALSTLFRRLSAIFAHVKKQCQCYGISSQPYVHNDKLCKYTNVFSCFTFAELYKSALNILYCKACSMPLFLSVAVTCADSQQFSCLSMQNSRSATCAIKRSTYFPT